MPYKRKAGNEKAKEEEEEEESKDSNNKTQSVLNFFPLKPISKLLPSDPEFIFVTELGKKLKHLMPVPTELINEFNKNEIRATEMINRMEEITTDTNMSEVDRVTQIQQLGIESMSIQSKIKEHKEYVKEVSHNKRKVESALSLVMKACHYWKNEDTNKYAEWLVVKMIAERLLQAFKDKSLNDIQNSIDEVDLGSRNESNITVIESDVEDIVEDEIDMVTTKDGNIVQIDTVLAPAEKANKLRVTKKLKKDVKYRVSSDYPFIPYKEYLQQLNGGKQRRRKSLKGQGFKWEDGALWCTLCNERFRQSRSMSRHCEIKDHCVKVERKKKGDKILHQRSLKYVDTMQEGMTVGDKEKEYRCGSLIAAANGNVPFKAIKYFSDWATPYTNMTVGHTTDLTRNYIGMIMATIKEDTRKILNDGSYPEFSLTFDGTPAFAEAEAIIIRVVTKEYKILELLVKCNLFKEKLNGVQLANHIVSTIKSRLGKDLKDWIASQQDRASTNKAALTHLKKLLADIQISINFCCSHTLNNAGKKMIGKDGSAPYAEEFRKIFQNVIQYPGKARDCATKVFGENVLHAGGVRFFLKYEQVNQIATQGVDKIMSDVLPTCKLHGWSQVSTDKIMTEYNGEENCAKLGMAMLEIASVADWGKVIAESCYSLEGDSAIILRAFAIFKRLEDTIADGSELVKVDQVVDKALELILKDRRRMSDKQLLVEGNLANVSSILENAKGVMNNLKSQKRNMLGGTSQNGRRRMNTERAINTTQLNKVKEDLVKAKEELRKAQVDYDKVLELKTKVDNDVKKAIENFPYNNKELLVNHAKSIGKPMIEYYHKLFTNEDGDCYNIRQMAEAAQIFNPIFLSGHTDAEIVTKLHLLIDKLIYFGYKQFTERFIKQLKKEIPEVVKEADRDHDLDRIDCSTQFKTRMQRRIKRKKLNKDSVVDWKLDDGEYACRIWEWWCARITNFPCFALALRLVVLAQLSSCSVERVFSRLKLIQDICGGGMYEDMLEMRLFIQCNGDVHEILNDMKE